MSAWLAALDRLSASGTPCVLVTVAAGRGSVPREPGTKMVVWREAFAGTIGGGQLEFKALEIAREMLAAGAAMDLRRFPLGASLGQCCGGAASLLFEPVTARASWIDALLAHERRLEPCVAATPERGGAKLVITAAEAPDGADPVVVARARELLGTRDAVLETIADARWLLDPSVRAELHVVLFGAGHVGRAIAGVLGALPCSVVWVDERDDAFPAQVAANVAVEPTDTPLAEVAAAPPGSCFLVMTHSHALDYDLAEAILRRGDFRYCGMIGSKTKRRSFEQRLERRGLDAAAVARLTCPIGVAGIAGKEPEVIAVAVAAQLLQLRGIAAAAAMPANANAG